MMLQFIWALLAISSIGTLFVFLSDGTAEMTRLSADGQNPISAARLAALGILLSACLLQIRAVQGLAGRTTLVLIILINLSVLWATGSRGPAVALLCGLAVLLTAPGKSRTNRISLTVAASSLGVAFFSSTSVQLGTERMLSLSDSGRTALAIDTIRVVWANPLGIGWGQLGEYLPLYPVGVEAGLYPHNLFLEFAVEAGLIGLIGICWLIISCVKVVYNAPVEQRPLHLPVFCVFVFAFINSMFSSDIVGNRLLWVALALIIGNSVALAGRSGLGQHAN
ncbi:hypothetical protein GCM10009821_27130 [Aeromicrobium halocynthiae]|uniref:O-antigen ligase-related domain-containing protein n=2 Tax=Aeromicrobium halocynthiae TaxID=560557 RepID=A0ABN2W849_9ACTN